MFKHRSLICGVITTTLFTIIIATFSPLSIAGPPAGKGGGKGDGGGGGGGDTPAQGEIYFMSGNSQGVMNQDGQGATLLPATFDRATPSVSLHNGFAWFVLIKTVPGMYPNERPRKEVFAVREDGYESLQLTNDPLFEPMFKTQPPRWAKDGEVFDGKVSFMGWTYDAAGSVTGSGIYTQQVAYDANDNPIGPLNGRSLAVSLPLDNDDEPSSENHSWSPDGTQVVYDGRGMPLQIRDVIVDETTVLTIGAHPDWAPDGSLIVFTSGSDIWTIAPDGSSESLILEDGSNKKTLRILSVRIAHFGPSAERGHGRTERMRWTWPCYVDCLGSDRRSPTRWTRDLSEEVAGGQ